MSSEVLERQLEEQHEVRMMHLSPLDPDCKRVIKEAAQRMAVRLNKAGWVRGEVLQKFRGGSRKKVESVKVHPLDPIGSATGKARPAYYVDKRGELYSWYDRNCVLEIVKLETMDLRERKRLEILLEINLGASH